MSMRVKLKGVIFGASKEDLIFLLVILSLKSKAYLYNIYHHPKHSFFFLEVISVLLQCHIEGIVLDYLMKLLLVALQCLALSARVNCAALLARYILFL